VIDLRQEQWKNALDLIRVNSESALSEIDESDMHDQRNNEQKIST
jgi:hypothetical protein